MERAWPPFLSTDIETYGKLSTLPPQTVFQPRRSHVIDAIPRLSQILTVSLTPIISPTYTISELSADVLSQWQCGPTMVFDLYHPQTRRKHLPILVAYLSNATLLLGMNIQFDLSYLRYNSPILKKALTPTRQLLIDLAVISYLQSEVRPERSLKTIGPILGTHTYDESDLQRLSSFPQIIDYNAQDTENTIRAASALARRITIAQEHPCLPSPLDPQRRNPDPLAGGSTMASTFTVGVPPPSPSTMPLTPTATGSPSSTNLTPTPGTSPTKTSKPSPTPRNGPYGQKAKLSPECLRFYSDTLWSCMFMSESGLPMSSTRLTRLHNRLTRRITLASNASPWIQPDPFTLEGPGSATSKGTLLRRLIETVNTHHQKTDPSFDILQHPSFELTKTNAISSSAGNRNLLTLYLPPSHPYRLHFFLWSLHTYSQKLSSTYCWPLLHHNRRNSSNRTQILVPPTPTSSHPFNPDTLISHPTWLIVPTTFKDGSGSSGGTQQGRITCKNSSHQTDPPPVRRARQSRYRYGHLLHVDLSQIELRVAALLSGEPSMVSEYLKPKPDLHTQMTMIIMGDSIVHHPHFKDGTPHDPRQAGKATNFLILFKGGPTKLQASLLESTGILTPLDQCSQIIHNATRGRPILTAWQNALIHTAETTHALTLPITGQSRTFAGGTKYEANEIVNFPIQTTAGNTLLALQHALIPYLLDNPSIHMCLNTYDALDFDAPTASHAHALSTHITETLATIESSGYWAHLCNHFDTFVPLRADTHIH